MLPTAADCCSAEPVPRDSFRRPRLFRRYSSTLTDTRNESNETGFTGPSGPILDCPFLPPSPPSPPSPIAASGGWSLLVAEIAAGGGRHGQLLLIALTPDSYNSHIMSDRINTQQSSERQDPATLLIRLLCLTALVLTAAITLPSELPLGVPAEWTWTRLSFPADIAELLDRLVPALTVGAILAGGSEWIARRIHRFGSGRRLVCLILLCIGMAGWLTSVLRTTGTPHRELRPLWVLYDRSMTGYFLNAVEDRRTTSEILRSYEATMLEGDVLHQGTHPPGLLLLNRAALDLAEAFPGFCSMLQTLIPPGSALIFRDLEWQARIAPRLTPTQFSALATLSVLSLLLTSCLPAVTYSIARQFGNAGNAWQSAVLSTTIPAIAVFQPRSDTVYATTSALILLLMLRTLHATRLATRLCWAAVAGLAVFCGLLVSLAHLPVLVAIAAYTLALLLLRRRHSSSAEPDASVLTLAAIATSGGTTLLSFLTTLVISSRLCGCSFAAIWQQNLVNHADFYQQYSRTWIKWFFVNPIELGVATGFAVMLIVPIALYRQFRFVLQYVRSGEPVHFGRLYQALLSLSLTATWLLLHCSGKNMGEAARLWIFLTPWWMLILAAPVGNSPSTPSLARTAGRTLLLSQLAAGILTSGLISGYSLL